MIIKKTLGFFTGTVVGLTVDLFVFQWVCYLGVAPFEANMLSSTLAIITNYFFLTTMLFRHQAHLKSFVVFFTYYVISISCFSFFIAALAEWSHWPSLGCKIVSLPLSFTVNAFVGQRILGTK